MAEQPTLGMSFYAAMSPNWPVDRALRCIPSTIKRPGVAIVWASFGYDTSFIERFVEKFRDREHVIEIHISNECSRRSGRSTEGACILPQLNNALYQESLIAKSARRAIRERLNEIKVTIAPFINANTRIYLSSGLELTLENDRALYNLHGMVETWTQAQDREEAGWTFHRDNIKLVYSPDGLPVGRFGANLIEAHAQNCYLFPKAEVINLDGCSLDFPGGAKFFQSIDSAKLNRWLDKRTTIPEAIFLWNGDQQGLRGIKNWNHRRPYSGREFYFDTATIRGMRQTLLQLQRRYRGK